MPDKNVSRLLSPEFWLFCFKFGVFLDVLAIIVELVLLRIFCESDKYPCGRTAVFDCILVIFPLRSTSSYYYNAKRAAMPNCAEHMYASIGVITRIHRVVAKKKSWMSFLTSPGHTRNYLLLLVPQPKTAYCYK